MVKSRKGATNRQLKRIDWATVRRIVKVLHDNNKIKRTNLAMKSGLSYDKCLLYLNWMKMLRMINIEIDEDGFEVISLSDEGEELFERNFENNSMHVAG